jgi:hypothetical protein
MSDELDLLRDFRSGLPVPDEGAADRVYSYATSSSQRFRWQELKSRLSTTRRPRLTVAIAVAGIAAAVVSATATIGGGAAPANAPARAAGVNSVLGQVQSAFGDGRLISASVAGSALTVTLSTTGPAAKTIGTFEGQVLAYAVNGWMQANNQEAISSVDYVDSTGQTLQDAATGDLVGSLPAAPALTGGACQTAAANAQSPLSVVSARTLPFAGGTCVVTLQTSDASAFGASAGSLLFAVQSAVPNAGDHPLLIEVDDQSGSPLVITSWVPGIDGVGQGVTWIRSGFDASLSHF